MLNCLVKKSANSKKHMHCNELCKLQTLADEKIGLSLVSLAVLRAMELLQEPLDDVTLPDGDMLFKSDPYLDKYKQEIQRR